MTKSSLKTKGAGLPTEGNRLREPFAVWVRLVDEITAQVPENQAFPEISSSLSWARRVIAARIPLAEEMLKTSADSVNGKATNEETGQRVDPAMPLPWSYQAAAYPWSPAIVYLASASRNDSLDRAIEILRRRFVDVPIRIILDEWWTGHRRTQPFAPGVDRAYWFQLFDLVVPEVLSIQAISHEPASLKPGMQGMAAEVSSLLVISDFADSRQLWLDLMTEYGWHVTAIRDESQLPAGRFDHIFIDPFDAPQAVDIERLRRVYTEAKVTVFFSFPRWENVEPCLAAGADFIVGKPFQLAGLLRSFSSAALPRR